MKIEFILSIAFLTFAMVVAILISAFDDEPQQTRDLYCEMVDIHKDTGGEYGWPDFDQNYDEVCR